MPIILYNNPAMTNAEIPVELVREFAADDFVLGIKDSSGNMLYFGELLDIAMQPGIVTPDDDSFPGTKLASSGDMPPKVDFKVFQGSERLIAESIGLGADGIVPSLANLLPKLLLNAVYDPEKQGIVNEIGEDIYCGYEKIVDGLLYALSAAGFYRIPGLTEPSTNLTLQEKATIRRRVSRCFGHRKSRRALRRANA
jgi:dihydrodipicolinate synthase/N-acetylneuraminate lyase